MNVRFATRTPALLLVSVLSNLALVACGDDGGKTTSPPASTAKSDAGANPSATESGAAGSSSSTAKPGTSSTAKPPGSVTPPVATLADGGIAPIPSGVPTLLPDGGVPPVGTGTLPPVGSTGNIDDLVNAICGWEFRCCDDGERTYRLGAAVTGIDSAAKCKAFFVDQLHNSNSAENPFASGNGAAGLLGALAYDINLDRVSVNGEAVKKCVAQWDALACNKPVPVVADRCTAESADLSTNPCDLGVLFAPKLKQNDSCNIKLKEASTNDVECAAGTTCLAKADVANGTDADRCIKRGVQDDFCNKASDCDYGYACDSVGHCVPKADEGDDCVADVMDPISTCKSGLSCDPQSSKCVQACATNYACSADIQCPSGESCAPVTVGDDTFHLCRALGMNAQSACDDEKDCIAAQYCTGGVCKADKQVDDDCTNVAGQCEAGTFCDSVTTKCKAYNKPVDACVMSVTPSTAPSPECDPSKTVGCFVRFEAVSGGSTSAAQYHCRSAKNANNEDCDNDFDCESGLCEVTTDVVIDHASMRCTAGANVGADCDSDVGTMTALRCKAGLRCNVSGKCETLLLPGADCKDPTSKMANSALCGGASCDSTHWKALMCTDAPVSIPNGGTGVQCDGK